MTQQEKIKWLSKATAEELIDQLYHAVTRMRSNDFNEAVEANGDYMLISAEMLKRMK